MQDEAPRDTAGAKPPQPGVDYRCYQFVGTGCHEELSRAGREALVVIATARPDNDNKGRIVRAWMLRFAG